MKTCLIHIRVSPSEEAYLSSFTTKSEGVRFLIRESMRKNLTKEEYDYLTSFDTSERKKAHHRESDY